MNTDCECVSNMVYIRMFNDSIATDQRTFTTHVYLKQT